MTFWQFIWKLIKRSFHFGWELTAIAHLAFPIVSGLCVIIFGVLFLREHQESYEYAFLAVLFAVAFLLAPYWQAYKLYREALEGRIPEPSERDDPELQRQNDLLKAHLTKIYDACERIYVLGEGAQAESACAICDEDVLIVIREDGTGRVTETFTFTAPVDVRNIQQTVYGDMAVPIGRLEIDAVADGGRTVIVLPSRDEPNNKLYLLFFSPDIRANSPPVTCTLKWEWPQLFGPLVQGGEDTWRWTARGCAPIPRMRFRFKIHKDQRPIRLSNTLGGGEFIQETREDEGGYREFTWQMTNVAPGSRIAIKLKKL